MTRNFMTENSMTENFMTENSMTEKTYCICNSIAVKRYMTGKFQRNKKKE